MKKSINLALLLCFIITVCAIAKPIRVTQIPNGDVYQCLNCHYTMDGGARNPFGQTIESKYLDKNGVVIWGAALAALDSDGDGIPNGVELQDKSGTWKRGQAAPGTQSLVSNPGDKTSFPVTAGVNELAGVYINQITAFPNPFNAYIRFELDIINNCNIKADVYDVNGRLWNTLFNSQVSAGTIALNWFGADLNGISAPSGVYFIKFSVGDKSTVLEFIKN